MTVLILENVSPGFRGEVTQWMLEVKPGVYVGRISAGVRMRLWDKVRKNVGEGAALLMNQYTHRGHPGIVRILPSRRAIGRSPLRVSFTVNKR